MDETAVLTVGGRPVADYAWRPDLPAAVSPRPYLHPVRTLGGTAVTALMPTSHRHHLGVSIALADVDGQNFWGSRTFIPGHGPAWLHNHGTQEHVRWIRRTPTGFRHSLRWLSVDGESLLTEQRGWSAQPVSPEVWALTCEFTLANSTGRTIRIQSPAGIGRAGAGFGGFFWNAPFGPGECRVAGAPGDTTEALHGARSPWLAVSARADEQRWWTLVFVAASPETRDDRWFLRTRDYFGIGSALSWEDPLLLDPGASLTRRITVLVADGVLPPAHAAELAAGFTT
jgi:methane monooxygenase PmoA-like